MVGGGQRPGQGGGRDTLIGLLILLASEALLLSLVRLHVLLEDPAGLGAGDDLRDALQARSPLACVGKRIAGRYTAVVHDLIPSAGWAQECLPHSPRCSAYLQIIPYLFTDIQYCVKLFTEYIQYRKADEYAEYEGIEAMDGHWTSS